MTVAVSLGARRRLRAAATALLLATAGDPDLVPGRTELLPRGVELALRPRDSELAFPFGRRAHALALGSELGLARTGVLGGVRGRGALGLRRGLRLGIVRRRDREPRLPREPVEERLRERRTFDRIGARGDLVDEDERALGRRAEDGDEVADV